MRSWPYVLAGTTQFTNRSRHRGGVVVKQALDYYPSRLYSVVSLVGILLVVIFMFFPGKELQLPCLIREVSEDGMNVVEGRLVAHADGYWWVFDESGSLMAIPNDGQARFEVEEPIGEACW